MNTFLKIINITSIVIAIGLLLLDLGIIINSPEYTVLFFGMLVIFAIHLLIVKQENKLSKGIQETQGYDVGISLISIFRNILFVSAYVPLIHLFTTNPLVKFLAIFTPIQLTLKKRRNALIASRYGSPLIKPS